MDIAIYGSGGFAREVAWLAGCCGYAVVCYIDDEHTRHGTVVDGIPVVDLTEAYATYPRARVVGGIGASGTRQAVMEKAAGAGFLTTRLVHPDTKMSGTVDIGDGSVVCAGSILTVDIVLGRHVQINLDCTIGHDARIGSFATLAPGVHVSGNVHIGERAYVGTGAVILNGTSGSPLTIGDDAVVGAGAVVTRAVAAGTTVIGVPARPVDR